MLVATLFLLGLGLAAAVLLSVFSRVFYVWEDPKLLELEDALLGANCGGCGYPGCAAAAAAVIADEAGADICVAGGMTIAVKVAEVLGVEVEVKEPETACTSCSYGTEAADTRYTYLGVNDCRAAMLYGQGSKVCPVGCMGLGSCVRACPFGAIVMGDEELPVVDPKRCRACGVCVEICPKGIMALTSTTDRMLGDYRTDECTTPCQRSCPTGINIPEYIDRISRGDFTEAIRVIKEKNPLPLVCGRICPAPCETDCRSLLAGDAVGINNLKRFAADAERRGGARVHPYQAPENTGHRVAVVGGGAQGLTSAYYLACLGHEPTVLEATGKLGGIVRKVIARSRLPEDVLDWEIEGILDAGVQAETDRAMGKDFTVNSLLDEGYKVVLLSTGGIDGREVMTEDAPPQQTVPGVHVLLDFLVAASDDSTPPVGKTAYIVGGGSSTLAAAEACLKAGAQNATIVYPYPSDELLARGMDITGAQSLGVNFLFSTVVSKLTGEGERLTGIALSEADGTTTVVAADTVVVATGRLSDLTFVRVEAEEEGQESARWASVEAGRMQPECDSEDVFNLSANGVLNDNVAVVRSIGRGRRLARAVHLVLTGKELEPLPDVIRPGTDILTIDRVEGVEAGSRALMPLDKEAAAGSDTDRLYSHVEIELGLNEADAKREADRCLRCGLICYRKAAA